MIPESMWLKICPVCGRVIGRGRNRIVIDEARRICSLTIHKALPVEVLYKRAPSSERRL